MAKSRPPFTYLGVRVTWCGKHRHWACKMCDPEQYAAVVDAEERVRKRMSNKETPCD